MWNLLLNAKRRTDKIRYGKDALRFHFWRSHEIIYSTFSKYLKADYFGLVWNQVQLHNQSCEKCTKLYEEVNLGLIFSSQTISL